MTTTPKAATVPSLERDAQRDSISARCQDAVRLIHKKTTADQRLRLIANEKRPLFKECKTFQAPMLFV